MTSDHRSSKVIIIKKLIGSKEKWSVFVTNSKVKKYNNSQTNKLKKCEECQQKSISTKLNS
jgi:hypothetical protein